MTPSVPDPSRLKDRRAWMAFTTWNVRKLHVTKDVLVTKIVAEYAKKNPRAICFLCLRFVDGYVTKNLFSFPTQTKASSYGIGFQTV
jgi:hypothetical protein